MHHPESIYLSAIRTPESKPSQDILDLYRLQANKDIQTSLLDISPRTGSALRLSDITTTMTRGIIDEIPVRFDYPRGGTGELVQRTAFLTSIYLKYLSTTSYLLPWSTASSPRRFSSTKNIPRVLVSALQFGEGEDTGQSGEFKDFFLNKMTKVQLLSHKDLAEVDLEAHLKSIVEGDSAWSRFSLQNYMDATYYAEFRAWMHRDFNPRLKEKLAQ